jgi:hypothetical protein
LLAKLSRSVSIEPQMRTVRRTVGSVLARALAGLFANTFGTYTYKAADRAGEVSKIIELILGFVSAPAMVRSSARLSIPNSTRQHGQVAAWIAGVAFAH